MIVDKLSQNVVIKDSSRIIYLKSWYEGLNYIEQQQSWIVNSNFNLYQLL